MCRPIGLSSIADGGSIQSYCSRCLRQTRSSVVAIQQLVREGEERRDSVVIPGHNVAWNAQLEADGDKKVV